MPPIGNSGIALLAERAWCLWYFLYEWSEPTSEQTLVEVSGKIGIPVILGSTSTQPLLSLIREVHQERTLSSPTCQPGKVVARKGMWPHRQLRVGTISL